MHRGKELLVSEYACVCTLVHLYYGALGGFDNIELDVNGLTDVEKEVRLEFTPGPCIAEVWCYLFVSPLGRFPTFNVLFMCLPLTHYL